MQDFKPKGPVYKLFLVQIWKNSIRKINSFYFSFLSLIMNFPVFLSSFTRKLSFDNELSSR